MLPLAGFKSHLIYFKRRCGLQSFMNSVCSKPYCKVLAGTAFEFEAFLYARLGDEGAFVVVSRSKFGPQGANHGWH